MKKRFFCFVMLIIPCLTNGQTWNNLGSGMVGCGPTGFFPLDKFYVGASCVGTSTFTGITISGICTLVGSQIDTLDSGLSGYVYDATWFNGQLIVGGNFSYAGPPPFGVPFTKDIAAWDTSTNLWSSLTPAAGLNSSVECMETYNGNLYIGGMMTSVNGVVCDRLAKWNGSTWSDVGGGVNGSFEQVNTMVEYHGWLYVGGDFSMVGAANLPASGIAKWNGTQWDSVGGGVGGWINALEVDTVNDLLYAAGAFTFAGDSVAFGVAVWNDTIWRPVGTGLDTLWATTDLEMFNGELYACGATVTVTTFGDTLKNIHKFNGTKWVSVNGGANNSTLYMEVFENNLYVGGAFSEVGYGIPANRIACYGTTCPTSVGISEQPPPVPFSMYPNPSDDVLHIRTQDPSEMIFRLYSSAGKLVKEQKFRSQLEYSTSTLSSGTYTVQVSLEDGSRAHSELLIVK